MLVLVAAWAVLSLLVGFAVSQAIRRADLPEVPSRAAVRPVPGNRPAGPPATSNRSTGGTRHPAH